MTKQILFAIRSNDFYVRAWDDTNQKWTNFDLFKSTTVISNTKYNASEPPTLGKFPVNTTTRAQYNNADAVTYGYPYAGIVETIIGTSVTFAYQRVYAIRSNIILYRAYDDVNSTWLEWLPLSNMINSVTFGVASYTDVPTMTHGRFNVNSSLLGDVIDLSAPPDIPAGIMYNGTVVQDGRFVVDIFNASQSAYNIKDSTWLYNIVR